MSLRRQKKAAFRLSPLAEARSGVLACGLLITLAAVVLLFYPPQLLRFFDFRIYDLMLSGQPEQSLSQQPVVVGIDEQSLARYGQWPWPRYRLAKLLDELQQHGVAAVGVDLLMPEEDRTSLDLILRERRRDLGEDCGLLPALQERESNDLLLARVLAATSSVLGFKFLSHADAEPVDVLPPALPGVVIRNERGEMPWREPQGVLGSLEVLQSAAAASGFVNAASDRDGVVRRMPLLQGFAGRYYPSLALATVLQAVGGGQLHFDVWQQEAALEFAGRTVPLDQGGNMLLGYSGAGGYRYVSAAELLEGTLPDGELQGAVVFVGAVAEGLGDRHVTPLQRNFPGVEIHAVIASNLLNSSWYSHPVWARGAEFWTVLLFGFCSAWLLSRFRLTVPLVLSAVVAGLFFWGSMMLFRSGHYFVSPTMPVLVLLLNAGLLGLVRYGIAAKNLRKRSRSLLKAQDATIVSLITLAETRDSDTGAHILRTQRFVRELAEQLRTDSSYASEISEEDAEMMFQSAPLHDIGKVGIPDRILLKSGTLTDEEIVVMREHPQLGAMALGCTADALELPEDSAYLHYARQMAETHHERWDGSGYPKGLKGEEIPLAGRLMALADVYDALVSERSYKEAMTHLQAREYILSKSGELFDPEIVRAFLSSEERFAAISNEYRNIEL
ncbi:adenylate cyclase [Malonomonas rubra DSM 5091]|uniref:Adenylate cyclase n=1 Tax=Malonomonas rubra DSM 5091 TaxID=1122189 RepID=A0A1M6FE24_MALRU|nr:CHASE2 domain-containing protein [Malonomonas rubra]SHI95984.1 adenylate cyclase [Malonomonas rubra DSM 5091]